MSKYALNLSIYGFSDMSLKPTYDIAVHQETIT